MRRKVLMITGGLLGAVLALLVFLLHTEAGLVFLASWALRLAGDSVTVTRVSGKISGTIRLHGARLALPEADLAVDLLSLRWNLMSLLGGDLDLESIQAEGVRVRLLEPESPRTDSADRGAGTPVPLRIVLRQAAITGIAVFPVGEEEPVPIEALELAGSLEAGGIDIRYLRVRTATVQAGLSGTISLAPERRVAAAVDWKLEAGGAVPFSGTGAVKGTLDSPVLKVLVNTPVQGTAELVTENLATDPSWSLAADVTGLRPEHLGGQPGKVEADVRITAGGTLADARMSATTEIRGLVPMGGGRVTASLRAAADRDRLTLSEARFRVEGSDLILEASGTLGLAEDRRDLQVRVSWASLHWPLDGREPVLISRTGELQVQGALTQYGFAATAAVAGRGWPERLWTARGDGDLQGLRIRALEMFPLGGAVTARGEVSFGPPLIWDGTVTGRDLDPGRLARRWPGSVRLAATLQGTVAKDAYDASVRLTDLSGTLRDRELDGQGLVRLTDRGPARIDLTLSVGQDSLALSGSREGEWDLAGSLELADLGFYLDGLEGRARLEGRLTGSETDPQAVLDLSLWQAAAGAVRLERADGRTRLRPAGDGRMELSLDLTGLQSGPVTLETVAVRSTGPLFLQKMEVAARTAGEAISASGSASYVNGEWSLSLTGGGLGGRFELEAESGAGEGAGAGWVARVSAADLDLDRVVRGLPAQVAVDAGILAEADVQPPRVLVRVGRLAATYQGRPVRATADVRLQGQEIRIGELEVWDGSSRLSASGTISDAWQVEWTFSMADAGVYAAVAGSLSASGRITGPRPGPVLEAQVTGRGLAAAGATIPLLEAVARIGVPPDGPLSLKLDLDDPVLGTVQAVGASARLDGSLARHTLDFGLEQTPWGDLGGRVEGRYESLRWDGSARLSTPAGALAAVAQVASGEENTWSLALETVDQVDPSTIWPEWPGSVGASLAVDGRLEEPGRNFSARLTSLSGVLRERDLSGNGVLVVAEGTLASAEGRLSMGRSLVTIEATMGTEVAAHLSVDIPDMGEILPGGAGRLEGQLRVTGSRARPFVAWEMRGRDLSVGPGGAERVDMSAAGAGAAADPYLLEATASGLAWRERSFDSLRVRAEGIPSGHRGSVEVSTPWGALQASAAGGYSGAAWTGTVDTLRFTPVIEGSSWVLTDPVRIEASRQRAESGRLCLAVGDGQVCGQGRWDRDGSGGRLVMKAVSADDLFAAAGLKNVDFPAAVSGSAEATLAGTRADMALALRTSAASLRYSPSPARTVTIPVQTIRADADLDQEGLRAGLGVDWGRPGEGGSIRGDIAVDRLQGAFSGVSPLDGSLTARITDLTVLSLLEPELRTAGGEFEAGVRVTGTLDRPLAEGEMDLAEGSVDIPVLGLKLRRIWGRVFSVDGRAVQMEAGCRSGRGEAKVSGRVVLPGVAGVSATFTLDAENFQVVQTPDASLVTTSAITASYDPSGMGLQGQIGFPYGRLRLQTASTGTSVSRDVVVIDAPEQAEGAGLPPLSARLTLELGDDVELEALGLSGKLRGTLEVVEEPETVPRGTGELEIVDGRYTAYGQRLEISPGRLIFAGGPLDNPGLDIRAVRRVGEVVAGVQVSGTAQAPILTLYSEPAMDQAEALSYLLLGKPLTGASREEGGMLQTAALGMGLVQGAAIAGKVGRAFGLEEVTVETAADVEESTLVVGKYISPRIYVRYGVGIFQSLSVFQVAYTLSRNLILQGESGIETGTDLLYTLEK